MPGKHRRAVPRRRRNAVTVTSTALAAGGLLAGSGSVALHADWEAIAGCLSGWNMARETVTNVQGAGDVPSGARHPRQQITVMQAALAASGLDTGPSCGRHASDSAAGRHVGSSSPRHAAADPVTGDAAPGRQQLANGNGKTITDPPVLSADDRLKVTHGGMAVPALAAPASAPATKVIDKKVRAKGPAPVAAAKPVTAKVATSATATAAASPQSAAAKLSTAARAVAAALAQQGTPYVYGGEAPGGFDCSGLVQWAYHKVNIALPRTAAAQSTAGHQISLNQLQPGDLLFFYRPVEHVVIYVGTDKIVEASQPGQPVHVRPLYLNGFVEARRVV
jgi:peptidoglycan DL-endopeptidase CwlO